jgi:hypothetical protein
MQGLQGNDAVDAAVSEFTCLYAINHNAMLLVTILPTAAACYH